MALKQRACSAEAELQNTQAEAREQVPAEHKQHDKLESHVDAARAELVTAQDELTCALAELTAQLGAEMERVSKLVSTVARRDAELARVKKEAKQQIAGALPSLFTVPT